MDSTISVSALEAVDRFYIVSTCSSVVETVTRNLSGGVFLPFHPVYAKLLDARCYIITANNGSLVLLLIQINITFLMSLQQLSRNMFFFRREIEGTGSASSAFRVQ